MRRSTRAGAHLPSDSSEIPAEVNEFLCNFDVHRPQHNHLQRAHHEVFDKLVQYQECPWQIYGIDCGLFCVGVMLHILVGKIIDRDTFSQEHVMELRLKLGDHFMGARHDRTNKTNHQPTSKVVQNCLPSLRGTTNVSMYGVEDVTPLPIPPADVNATAKTIANAITTTRSTTRALAHASIPKENDGEDSDNNSSESNICQSKNDNTCIDVDSVHTDGLQLGRL